MDSNDVRNKVLPKLEKKINDLENSISRVKKENVKRKRIKNLKLGSLELLNRGHYLLTATSIIALSSFCGATPFITDKREQNPYFKNEFDSLGNEKYIEQYEDFETETNNVKSILTYHSKWRKNSDNSYVQTVKVYDVNNKTYENLKKVFDKDEVELNDILGNPIKTTEITRENIREDTLKEDAYFKCVIYDINKNECKVFKESAYENICTTVIVLAMIAFFEMGVRVIDDFLLEDFHKRIYSYMSFVEKKHSELDVNHLKEELLEMKKTYNNVKKK